MPTLHLVATPIGNLEDITARALRVLREVNLIAAEDTRHTGKLLAHFDIQTRLTSYYEHNKLSKLDRILAALEVGDVALVSDAGTPALNDPGFELVRAALEAGHTVSPVPGPSAPIAALVSSGLPTDRFLYLGYLPRKTRDRRRMAEEVASLPYTLIFLESPHRLLAALEDMQTVFGDRQIAVARELTKLHEEIFRGRISQAAAHFRETPPRGEITLVVAGALAETERWLPDRVRAAIAESLPSGEAPSQIARRVALESGWPRREVYRILTTDHRPPTDDRRRHLKQVQGMS
ncbi:MAG: 16S rRNA (cytidine(1402)-2'-O)-methyltransferase [Chloroflexi bacterium]|nr:16S rRNA (cytidine(1402)-2'-O)-methyltransferase [Chloroflexota bacterium]